MLADFPMEIRAAFQLYLFSNSEMPAPADIAQIILRKGKPPFERAVYIRIAGTRPEDRSPEEWQYLRDYEQFVVSGRY